MESDSDGQRWRGSVDMKLERLSTFADKYEALLDMLIKRETERAEFRKAVMEKTLSGLILAAVVGLMSLAWTGLTGEIRNVINAVRK